MAKDTNIKLKLREAKISQAEVARELNLTVQHVNYVVNGTRKSNRLAILISAMCKRKLSTKQN